jgi:hypothetical protein
LKKTAKQLKIAHPEKGTFAACWRKALNNSMPFLLMVQKL